MIPDNTTPMTSHLRFLICTVLVLVFSVYILQTLTPLRLVGDGIDYLLQASSAADGHGFLVHGQASMRPPGYPFLIFTAIKLGVGKPWAIVALNCVFLAIGCIGTYALSRHAFGLGAAPASVICLLTLLSFVFVRQITQPLSDVSFFAVSILCIFLLARAESDRHAHGGFWRMACIGLLIAACIELRTVGFTLIPGFGWVLLGGRPRITALLHSYRHHIVPALLISLAAVVLAIWAGTLVVHTRYFQFNQPILEHSGVFGTVVSNVWDHTLEWGEMAANVPASKLPAGFANALRGIGAVAMMIFAVGLWDRRSRLGGAEVYVVGFTFVVIAYPWFDTRLWLPLLPLLMNYFYVGLKRLSSPSILTPAVWGHCSVFCLFGFLALAYSTRLTFSGSRFPELYGDGRLQSAYIVAAGGRPADYKDVDTDAVYLLRRYR